MFWVDSPRVLIRLTDLAPQKSQPLDEQLNSVMRVSLAVSLVFSVFNIKWLWLAVFAAVATILIWENYKSMPAADQILSSIVGGGAQTPSEAQDLLNRLVINADEKVCVRPTPDNPFMNVGYADYFDMPNRPPACNIDHPSVAEAQSSYARLYEGSSTLAFHPNEADQRYAQLKFHSMPVSTIPNDRETFVNWLYKPTEVFKDGDGTAAPLYFNAELRRGGSVALELNPIR